MTNFEKYKDEILKITNKELNFAITKKGEVKECAESKCPSECIFYTGESPCMSKKIKWLYKEASRWTDDEIALARALKNLGIKGIKRFEAGGRVWFDEEISGYLPHKAFAGLQLGEQIYIDDIIAEGDN